MAMQFHVFTKKWDKESDTKSIVSSVVNGARIALAVFAHNS
jgi:hypothetical protein